MPFLRRYRKALTIIWFVMITFLIAVLLYQKVDRGMVEEATYRSITLSVDHQYSLEWTFVWLGLRYFSLASFAALFFLTGTLVFIRRPDSGIAVYLAIVFISLAVGQLTGNRHFFEEPTLANWIYRLMDVISVFSAVVLFYVMPDGRFVPSWTPVASIIWTIITALWTFFPDLPFNPLNNHSFDATRTASVIVLLIPISTGIYGQIYRWRTAKSEEARQQIRWMFTGMLLMILSGINLYAFSYTTVSRMIREIISVIVAAGFPICLSIAVTKHRLWELNSIINQALVWLVMTAIVILTFVLVVGGIGNLLNSPSNPILSATATALVAIFFQPARQHTQKAINRYLFGMRDDPLAIISLLGERNQTGYGPDRLMDETIETVAQLLKLPYVNVELLNGNQSYTAATFGSAVADIVRLPLMYQSKSIGYLIVGSRAPGESFNSDDIRLLETISWQIAALGHILQLNADLQRSRERLVIVAEKERQRLQRDLHDGLGTELSAQMIKIGTARAQVHREPDRADELLMDVEQKLVDAVGEVRRLIHNLRPPVLEQLGFFKTLQILVEEHQMRDFNITLQLPETTYRIPPAVEIAAYRIVQEAITNVIKHANATNCHIDIVLGENLELHVSDSGIGIPEAFTRGVGLRSMRERAEELGGSLEVGRRPEGGTQISAMLPLHNSKGHY